MRRRQRLGMFGGLAALAAFGLSTSAWAVTGPNKFLGPTAATFADGRTWSFAGHFYYRWSTNSGGVTVGLYGEDHNGSDCGDANTVCGLTGFAVKTKQTSGTVYTQADKLPAFRAKIFEGGTARSTFPSSTSYLYLSPGALNTWDWAEIGGIGGWAAAQPSGSWTVTLYIFEQSGGSHHDRNQVSTGNL